jgi:hypothetical protein
MIYIFIVYRRKRQFLDRSNLIRVVHVVIVQLTVVAVEDPRVVRVVPLTEPTVRGGDEHH